MVKAVTLFICALLAVSSASAKQVQSVGADAALEHVKSNQAELQRNLKDSPEQEAAKDASKRAEDAAKDAAKAKEDAAKDAAKAAEDAAKADADRKRDADKAAADKTKREEQAKKRAANPCSRKSSSSSSSVTGSSNAAKSLQGLQPNVFNSKHKGALKKRGSKSGGADETPHSEDPEHHSEDHSELENHFDDKGGLRADGTIDDSSDDYGCYDDNSIGDDHYYHHADYSEDRDIAILQFALNLEFLEAEFYSWASGGGGLPECAKGSVGGKAVNFKSPEMLSYAKELAKNELNHVRFLQKALGKKSVPCPALNIGTAFATAADAAVGTKLNPPFDPFRNDEWFALGAFIFEDVGVTAYNGALALIKDPKVLAAAAGIASVEAYHAGTVRQYLHSIKDTVLAPYTFTVSEAVAKISASRTKVGGGKDNGFITAGDASLVPADVDSIAFARNTTEVLSMVGGFFPEGLTGTFR